MDIFGSSSASTPTGGGNYLPSPLSPMADTSLQNSIQNSASTTPVTNSGKYNQVHDNYNKLGIWYTYLSCI